MGNEINHIARVEADAIAELAKKAFAADTLTLGVEGNDHPVSQAEVLILPAHLKAESIKPYLDEYLTAPLRRRGVAKLVDLASFIAHVKRFSDTDSALFAMPDTASPTMIGVLDYHRTGPEGLPRFGTHRAHYSFPLSPEWTTWTTSAGKQFGQAEFAAFVEDHLVDVLDPAGAGASALALAATIGCDFASPSKLLELSRGLSIRVDARARQQVVLASGETQILYSTEHQDDKGAPLRVPGAFLVGIPVFRAGVAYQIAVRLRYRLREGAVAWSFDLYRADRAFDDAFDEACALASSQTGLPLFKGTPES